MTSITRFQNFVIDKIGHLPSNWDQVWSIFLYNERVLPYLDELDFEKFIRLEYTKKGLVEGYQLTEPENALYPLQDNLVKIKNLMRIGADANILVYDCNAGSGVPTSRLLALLKSTARANFINIDSILVDEMFIQDFQYSGTLPKLLSFADTQIKIYGLNVLVSKYNFNFSLEHSLADYWNKELSASLQYSDVSMLIAFNSKAKNITSKDVLMASY